MTASPGSPTSTLRRFLNTETCSRATTTGRPHAGPRAQGERPVTAGWSLTRSPDTWPASVDCAEEATRRFLARLGMGIDEIDLLVPAPSSPDFLDSVTVRLGVPGDRVAYVAEDLVGAYTAGPVAALEAAFKSGRLGEARNTLMLAAGAGITVALALYRQTPP